MNPGYLNITDMENLHKVFRGYRSHDGMGWLFRGQADASWPLLPKAGRSNFYLPENRDLGRLWAWARQAIAYSDLPGGCMEQLAIAQHHGLATRLLDWTMNPLVACFFACAEHPDKDGAVYLYETPEKIFEDETTIDDLKKHVGLFGYMPRSISPRLMNQRGIFTVHCDAKYPIEAKESRLNNGTSNLLVLKIPSKLKEEISKHLEDYGIDRTHIFPDLDGLSAHTNTKTLRMRRPTL